jgi:hypothetical protein
MLVENRERNGMVFLDFSKNVAEILHPRKTAINVGSDPEDPKFDLEKLFAKWEKAT